VAIEENYSKTGFFVKANYFLKIVYSVEFGGNFFEETKCGIDVVFFSN
jgi:hypothetical protein